MKRRKNLLNLIIFLVAIFFAYQVFSYINTKTSEKKSIEIYREIEENSKIDTEEKLDFDYLKNLNTNFIGWIKSDEGSIDYPIVKHNENNSFYLRHAINKDKNIMGSIFMDYRNTGFDDKFIMIYGHMTKNNSMFGSLNMFKENPIEDGFKIITEMQEINTKAVLAGIISGKNYINPSEYNDFNKRKEFYNLVKENSVYDIGYELKEEDDMINLITCTYERKNSRLVVITIKENH